MGERALIERQITRRGAEKLGQPGGERGQKPLPSRCQRVAPNQVQGSSRLAFPLVE